MTNIWFFVLLIFSGNQIEYILWCLIFYWECNMCSNWFAERYSPTRVKTVWFDPIYEIFQSIPLIFGLNFSNWIGSWSFKIKPSRTVAIHMSVQFETIVWRRFRLWFGGSLGQLILKININFYLFINLQYNSVQIVHLKSQTESYHKIVGFKSDQTVKSLVCMVW